MTDHETPPLVVAIFTYLSYGVLIVWGHIRDFSRKVLTSVGLRSLLRPDGSEGKRDVGNEAGYGELLSDFDNFYTRRLYHRIRDCWNRPVCSAPGAYITLSERVSNDYNKSFEVTGKQQTKHPTNQHPSNQHPNTPTPQHPTTIQHTTSNIQHTTPTPTTNTTNIQQQHTTQQPITLLPQQCTPTLWTNTIYPNTQQPQQPFLQPNLTTVCEPNNCVGQEKHTGRSTWGRTTTLGLQRTTGRRCLR